MDAIIASLITGGLSLIGIIITVNASQRKTETAIKTDLAVMNNEVKNLRKEVEKHNNFVERVPKLEEFKEEAIKRFERLEDFHME